MKPLTVRHTTLYRYARPVGFGPHRLMLRPRDSHDLRLVRTELALSPPAQLRWIHDVFGNSVALAHFAGTASELRIESALHIERYALDRPAFELDPEARTYPFVYSSDDRTDLGPAARAPLARPERDDRRMGEALRDGAADGHARAPCRA